MEGKFDESLTLLQSVCGEIIGSKERFLEEGKSDLIHLVILICEKILQEKLNNPANFSHLLEKLLKQAKAIAHGEHVQVLLSAEDLQLFEESLEQLNYDKHNITKLDFLSDPSIAKQSCRIESSLGIIHFNLKRELAHLEEALREGPHLDQSSK